MKKMKTLTVNGVQYTVDDPDSVSYGQTQTLTEEQKTTARNNISAVGVGDMLIIKDRDGLFISLDSLGHYDGDEANVFVFRHPLNADSRLCCIAPGIRDNDAVNKKQMEDAIALAQQNSGAILCTPQELTDEQKIQARDNIGAASTETTDLLTTGVQLATAMFNKVNEDLNELEGDAVLSAEQELTSQQQAQARQNIGAVSSSEMDEAIEQAQQNSGAILYTEQELTSQQQAQARDNIGAVSGGEMNEAIAQAAAAPQYELIETITLTEEATSILRTKDTNGKAYDFSAVFLRAEIPAAASSQQVIIAVRGESGGTGSNMVYHQINRGITTAANNLVCKAYNDHGLLDYYVQSGKSEGYEVPLYKKPNYFKKWKNVVRIELTAYEAVFPVGTKVTIYGVRG